MFQASAARIAESPAWYLFMVEHPRRPPGVWDPYALGIIKLYERPVVGGKLFGLEAAWFADSDTDTHLRIVAAIRDSAAMNSISGVCIAQHSLSHPETLEYLLRAHDITELPDFDCGLGHLQG